MPLAWREVVSTPDVGECRLGRECLEAMQDDMSNLSDEGGDETTGVGEPTNTQLTMLANAFDCHTQRITYHKSRRARGQSHE